MHFPVSDTIFIVLYAMLKTQYFISVKWRIDMPQQAHKQAAEHHEKAAKAHHEAAESQSKESSEKAHKSSTTAHEHSSKAHEKSKGK